MTPAAFLRRDRTAFECVLKCLELNPFSWLGDASKLKENAKILLGAKGTLRGLKATLSRHGHLDGVSLSSSHHYIPVLDRSIGCNILPIHCNPSRILKLDQSGCILHRDFPYGVVWDPQGMVSWHARCQTVRRASLIVRDLYGCGHFRYPPKSQETRCRHEEQH